MLVVGSLALTACSLSGTLVAGAEKETETIGETTNSRSRVYTEAKVEGSTTFGGSSVSRFGTNLMKSSGVSTVNLSSWEMELVTSTGLVTVIENNRATVSAFNGGYSYTERVFPLTITNNKARFSNPAAVEDFILQQEGVANKFRVEVIASTVNSARSMGTVQVKVNKGGSTQAMTSYRVAAALGACGVDGPPSEFDMIC